MSIIMLTARGEDVDRIVGLELGADDYVVKPFISIIIAILLSRSITRPLMTMTKSSEEMARGNYEQVIPAEGRDEVPCLADSFNCMAREVERARMAAI